LEVILASTKGFLFSWDVVVAGNTDLTEFPRAAAFEVPQKIEGLFLVKSSTHPRVSGSIFSLQFLIFPVLLKSSIAGNAFLAIG